MRYLVPWMAATLLGAATLALMSARGSPAHPVTPLPAADASGQPRDATGAGSSVRISVELAFEFAD